MKSVFAIFVVLMFLGILVFFLRKNSTKIIFVGTKRMKRNELLPDNEGYNIQGNAYAYSPGQGPYPGKSLNIPVPQGSLKESSEEYGYPFYKLYRGAPPYDYFRPYGPNQKLKDVVVTDRSIYDRSKQRMGFGFAANPNIPKGGLPKYTPETLPKGFTPGYTGSAPIPFYSSVSAFAPFPEIYTPWEKVGVLTTVNPQDDSILELYRRPVAPLQDLFEYSVQDKNGFILQLRGTNYLRTGDIIPNVLGKESKGPWKVTQFIKNKWVWA